MNELVDKNALKSQLETVITELDNIYDPLDKIDKVAEFIKEILIAHDTDEVVLASPTPDPSTPEELEECIEDEYEMSLDEYIDSINSGEKAFWWAEPYWIYDCEGSGIVQNIQFWNQSIWLNITVVRFGIVNNKLMLTLQQGKAENIEDSSDPDNIEPETDWLKPGNIIDVSYWIDLTKLLLNCDDIWKYNQMFPGLRKMNR